MPDVSARETPLEFNPPVLVNPIFKMDCEKSLRPLYVCTPEGVGTGIQLIGCHGCGPASMGSVYTRKIQKHFFTSAC